jgi:regulator of sigma E protease
MMAKAFRVNVIEFSIGMGPRLLKKQGKHTLYSLRALPIGGSCLMEGEDEETGTAGSFSAQPRWKRLLILLAGPFANFLFGAVVVLILVSQFNFFVGPTVTELADGFPLEGRDGLMAGDRIVSIEGEKVYYYEDFSTFMMLYGDHPVDIVVERDGHEVTLDNLPLEQREYVYDGQTELKYGITFNTIEGTGGEKLKYAAYSTMNFVRLIRVSLTEIFTGRVGWGEVSGPVYIVNVMNDIGRQSESFRAAVFNMSWLGALIAVNLAVMNLLPIPALDGGRIFFMIVTLLVEKIGRRHINPKYEGYVHAAGFFLLIGLMLVIMVNDVVKIVHG